MRSAQGGRAMPRPVRRTPRGSRSWLGQSAWRRSQPRPSSTSIGEVVVVRPSSGFGVPRPSWVLNSFTVSRRAAVALAWEDGAGKADGTFQAEASISRGDAGQAWRADRHRAIGQQGPGAAREQVSRSGFKHQSWGLRTRGEARAARSDEGHARTRPYRGVAGTAGLGPGSTTAPGSPPDQ